MIPIRSAAARLFSCIAPAERPPSQEAGPSGTQGMPAGPSLPVRGKRSLLQTGYGTKREQTPMTREAALKKIENWVEKAGKDRTIRESIAAQIREGWNYQAQEPLKLTLKSESWAAIENLPPLPPATEILTLMHFGQLKTLPDLSACTNLHELFIRDCNNLTRLPDLSTCGLKSLTIQYCEAMTDLSGIAACTELRDLEIGRLPRLCTLPSLENVKKLERIDIEACNIEALPDLSELENLKELSLKNCNWIAAPPVMGSLPSLNKLQILNCLRFATAPDLSGLAALRELTLCNTAVVAPPANMKECANLESLDMSSNPALATLPEITNLPALETLDLSQNPAVKEPPVLRDLPKLKSINLYNCAGMTARPDLGSCAPEVKISGPGHLPA